MKWLATLLLYVVATLSAYGYLRYKVLREMVEKQIVTTVSGKELAVLIDSLFGIMLILGIFVGIISPFMLAALIIAVLILIPVVIYDLFKSVMFYYMIVMSRMINVGDFVIMTRGIRGWIKRITPFFVELRGEHDEVVRIPNSLAATEPVRIPSKSLPFTVLLKIYADHVKLNEVEEVIKESIKATKRYSVLEPRLKLRSISDKHVEYEILYGLGNYEVTNDILKMLAQRLKRGLQPMGVSFEVRVEHALMTR